MKRPGRRRDSQGSDRSEREDLARARRERARRARADLAAKAQGDDGVGAEEEAPIEGKAADEGAAAKKSATKRPDPKDSDRPQGSRKSSKPDRKAKDPKSEDRKPKRLKRWRPGPAEAEDKRRRRGSRTRADGDRRSRREGAKRAGTGAVRALKQGTAETRSRARKAAPGVAAGALALAATLFGFFFTGLAFVLNLLIAVYRFAAGPLREALRIARRGLRTLSRAVTPVRVLGLVVAGALVLLALSQFADYRNISIGNDAYAEGIQTVAPAPIRDTAETGSAHSYLMLPLAGVSLLVLVLALRGRWRLCRLLALAGIAVIAVGLIHDRPVGLDPGDEAVAYTGVKATLIGGFYAQLFSGLLLTLSALLLGRELKLAGARRRSRAPRGSRTRRRFLRRNPRVEGVRA